MKGVANAMTDDEDYVDGARIPCAIYIDGDLKNETSKYFCLVYRGPEFSGSNYKTVDVNHMVVAHLGDQITNTQVIRIGVEVVNPVVESV
jgi:hypothetical protein